MVAVRLCCVPFAKGISPRTSFRSRQPILELKINDTAQDALAQIDRKGYALPYLPEGRKVVKVGIQFDRDTMTVGEYLVA